MLQILFRDSSFLLSVKISVTPEFHYSKIISGYIPEWDYKILRIYECYSFFSNRIIKILKILSINCYIENNRGEKFGEC